MLKLFRRFLLAWDLNVVVIGHSKNPALPNQLVLFVLRRASVVDVDIIIDYVEAANLICPRIS